MPVQDIDTVQWKAEGSEADCHGLMSDSDNPLPSLLKINLNIRLYLSYSKRHHWPKLLLHCMKTFILKTCACINSTKS